MSDGKRPQHPTAEDRLAMCGGKERFTSPALAHRIAKRRKWSRGHQDVYRCPACNGWHQGTPSR
jgi:predicted RNA-binding Zn-ribbon protein involved in translation (DUF1610 family)